MAKARQIAAQRFNERRFSNTRRARNTNPQCPARCRHDMRQQGGSIKAMHSLCRLHQGDALGQRPALPRKNLLR